MDTAAVASAFIGAQNDNTQLALAANMMRMNADQEASVAKLVETAQQNATRLANVAKGIGVNLDISV